MRRPHLLFLAALAAAALPPAAAFADVLVVVDKSAQRMTVTVDGQERYSWPVSTGVAGHDTPSGSFQPSRMDRDHFSREWDDAPMPNSIFFTAMGHAIHGTGHVASLGRPASHGCVRLSRAHSAQLFALVKAEGLGNTRVVVEGEDPGLTDPVDAGTDQVRYGDGGLYADDDASGGVPKRHRPGRARDVAPSLSGDDGYGYGDAAGDDEGEFR